MACVCVCVYVREVEKERAKPKDELQGCRKYLDKYCK